MGLAITIGVLSVQTSTPRMFADRPGQVERLTANPAHAPSMAFVGLAAVTSAWTTDGGRSVFVAGHYGNPFAFVGIEVAESFDSVMVSPVIGIWAAWLAAGAGPTTLEARSWIERIPLSSPLRDRALIVPMDARDLE